MKILWICNMIFPAQAEFLGIESVIRGGWLLGMANSLKKNCNQKLIICSFTSLVNDVKKVETEGHDYYLIPNFGDVYECSKNVYSDLCNILKNESPDLVHIHGTEFSHTLEAVNVCNYLGIKHLIGIQGLTGTCAVHYLNNIPWKYQKIYTIRDLIKRQNLTTQMKQFYKRGLKEVDSLKKTEYIVGRTNWDRGTTALINSNRKYYSCNEILRDSFYEGDEWNINSCKRNSIFISQAYYPIKGFHTLLKALAIVKKDFPDVKVKVAGVKLYSSNSIADKLKISSYGLYIKRLIERNNLSENVIFLGGLEEEEMKQHYLDSHIFVSPSIIENESNSVSEAKILGVPTISSYVGGVADRIKHYEDGLIYPADEYYMLAFYIMELLKNDDLAQELSKNAIKSQSIINDPVNNARRMMDIYFDINKDI